jgi:hypothetical protein
LSSFWEVDFIVNLKGPSGFTQQWMKTAALLSRGFFEFAAEITSLPMISTTWNPSFDLSFSEYSYGDLTPGRANVN